jgi:hypothetical protein
MLEDELTQHTSLSINSPLKYCVMTLMCCALDRFELSAHGILLAQVTS